LREGGNNVVRSKVEKTGENKKERGTYRTRLSHFVGTVAHTRKKN
jgi:hypothetical protein